MGHIFQLTPLVLVFIIIVVGYYIGKIKIFGISLDLSGVLIIAICCGTLINRFPHLIIADNSFFLSMSFLSSLGTSLFVSAIGLSAGYMLRTNNSLSNLLSMFVGATMVIIAFLTVGFIGFLDRDYNKSIMLGILCGSMTSTPGLSAVNELPDIDSNLSTAGYGCAYLFGVIGVVLFVQICILKHRNNCKYIVMDKETCHSEAELQGIIQIAVAIILGTIIGRIKIPVINFTLGSSGGILCSGMIIGALISKTREEKEIAKGAVSLIRNIGLVFFFVGSGVPAGFNLSEVIQIKYILYGLLITISTMVLGYFISHIITKNDKIYSLCNVCGGMTSTPAIGVLSRKCNCEDGLIRYSMAYVGALFMMVVGIRMI